MILCKRLIAGVVALVAGPVAGLLLDCVEGIGGVEDGDAVDVLEVTQMLVAGDDEFGVGGERGGEDDVIVGTAGDGAGEDCGFDAVGKNAIAIAGIESCFSARRLANF